VASPCRVRRLLSSRSSGATALEFALIFPVFMLFVSMIVENGLVLFTQATLDNAVFDASRLIRTGQIQLAGGSPTPFATALCNDIGVIVPCASLQYNVQSAAAFSSLSATVQLTANGNLATTSFVPGGAGQDVLVQVAYNRPYLMPWISIFGGKTGAVMVSTLAFENEKYQ
jgi:Flp pilus assembly protein TadG